MINNTTFCNNNVNFMAIPRAKYKLHTGETIRLLELEKKDLPFIEEFCSNINKYMDKKKIETVTDKRLIIDTSFQVINEILKLPEKLKNKTKMFIAESNNDICGVLVGGMPKLTSKNSIKHSSRKFSRNNETELNWCASWLSTPDKPRKGIGKIMLSEYINTVKRDGFDKIFIQSEIPELSFAKKFYEQMGFKALSEQKPHRQVEQNKDIVKCVEDLYDYNIVPMMGNVTSLNNAKNKVFAEYKRQILPESSIDLYKEIKQ